MRSLDFCSTFDQAKVEKEISLFENEHGSFTKLKKSADFLSLFIGLKSNQKRLLNFYKELAMNLSAVADVTADELSLRAMALMLGLHLREPHLRSVRSLALCKSLVSGKE